MKISSNWLKEYINPSSNLDELSEVLTDIGLEVEGMHKIEPVKGGLEGVVIGEVKALSQHPNADRLQLCKVDVGHAELLDIVCGAPNVAKGQKVLVALVGATLYPDENGFKIKKSKIRGELSEGMLCAEDELGLGESHDGIMVLAEDAKVGQAAADYFQLESDVQIEIGLTPNRVDAASHFGVARDLAVYYGQDENINLSRAKVPSLKKPQNPLAIELEIKDEQACPRYSGICMSGIKVEASPAWLQNRLKAIGLKPINNVVDISNYVLHDIGQPIHIFDYEKISGSKVIVQKAKANSTLTTLDEVERKLDEEDLMICNDKQAMCIAGVFGGLDSGVSESTSSIFIESAYFTPVGIRKTAKRHGLNTDASFRYERGADPEITVYALQRAVGLIQEIAGGEIASDLIDHYPQKIEEKLIQFNLKNAERLIGQTIDKKRVRNILEGLEIRILNEEKDEMRLAVPSYRVDVEREVDIVEELLRIYGYNNIAEPDNFKMNPAPAKKPNPQYFENKLADYLAANGLSEIFTNSLSNPAYYQEKETLVNMLNPLSSELGVLRANMLYGGLEAIAYNKNRKRKNLGFFEFGKEYRKEEKAYKETACLSIWMTGDLKEENWNEKNRPLSLFELKSLAENALCLAGLNRYKIQDLAQNEYAQNGLTYWIGKEKLMELVLINNTQLNKFSIKDPVFFAKINWTLLLARVGAAYPQYTPVVKFPVVRRDLALLLEEKVAFSAIEKLAKDHLKQALVGINLFDVYEGKNLPAGKKSYAVSFHLQDKNKTLSDKQIDGMMNRLIEGLQKELNAELR